MARKPHWTARLRGRGMVITALAAMALVFGGIGGRLATADITVRDMPRPAWVKHDPASAPEPPEASFAEGDPRAHRRLREIDYNEISRECGDGCSDFDLGRLWAEREGVGDAGQCMGYSWSYQRGCLAWLREGHARRPPA